MMMAPCALIDFETIGHAVAGLGLTFLFDAMAQMPRLSQSQTRGVIAAQERYRLKETPQS